MIPRLLILPLFLSLQLASLQVAATTVLPMSLERVTSAAAVIFHGRVISSEVKQDPQSGQIATVTEFEVLDAVKGNPGKTHTIKQIGGQLPGSNRRLVIHGVPEFDIDQEYVVFLPEASSLGFASPIGLSRGKFDVRKQDGKAVVRPAPSDKLNSPLQQALPGTPAAVEAGIAPDQARATELAEFLQNIRSMARE